MTWRDESVASKTGGEDPVFASKLISLTQELDRLAVGQRLKDNDAARNCASAAASLRNWLDDLGLGPQTEPLK
jgi:hypothetical protein